MLYLLDRGNDGYILLELGIKIHSAKEMMVTIRSIFEEILLIPSGFTWKYLSQTGLRTPQENFTKVLYFS